MYTATPVMEIKEIDISCGYHLATPTKAVQYIIKTMHIFSAHDFIGLITNVTHKHAQKRTSTLVYTYRHLHMYTHLQTHVYRLEL